MPAANGLLALARGTRADACRIQRRKGRGDMSSPDDPERFTEAKPRSPLGDLFASAARDLPSDEQLARLAAQLGPVLDSPPSAPQVPAAASGASGLVKVAVVAGALAAL